MSKTARQTSRISLELPLDLLTRLERQVEYVGEPRHTLIVTAIMGLVLEFERIDRESGVACPRCEALTELDTIDGQSRRVCTACTWNWPEPLEVANR